MEKSMRWMLFRAMPVMSSTFETWKNPDTSKTRKTRRERARRLTVIRERQLRETKGEK